MNHHWYREIENRKRVTANKLWQVICAIASIWTRRDNPGIGKLSKTSHRRLLERLNEETELLYDLTYTPIPTHFPSRRYRRQVINVQKLRYGKLYVWDRARVIYVSAKEES